jgi:hypothetical protein
LPIENSEEPLKWMEPSFFVELMLFTANVAPAHFGRFGEAARAREKNGGPT